MDEKRLIVAWHQARRNRKFACIHNDIEKAKLDTYEQVLGKERDEIMFKLYQDIEPLKILLARRRSLQKCLEIHQQNNATNSNSKTFGRYDGLSLDDMRRDVDEYIYSNQPRHRRLRQAQKLLSGGKRTGALLDRTTAKEKIRHMFDKFQNEREQLLAELRRERPIDSRKFKHKWITPPMGRKSLGSTLAEFRSRLKILPPIAHGK